jgi:hypothetical protein
MQPLLNGISLQLVIKFALTAGALLALGAVCALLIFLLMKLISVKNQRDHSIRVTNQGNVRSTYQLSVESREALLKFKLLTSKGAPLVELPTYVPQAAAPAHAQKAEKAPRPKGGKKQSAAPKGGTPATKQLADGGKAATSSVGTAASLLGAVGGFLPGSAGAALKEQGGNLRNAQTKANETMRAPEDARRRAEAVQKDGSRLAGQKQAGRQPGREIEDVDETAPATGAVRANVPPAQAPGPARVGYWVETAEVGPGESIQLTLRIAPKRNQFREGSFPYTFISQQVPVHKLNKEATPVTKAGVVHLKPVAAWRYALRIIFSAAIIVTALLSIVFIVPFIWK